MVDLDIMLRDLFLNGCILIAFLFVLNQLHYHYHMKNSASLRYKLAYGMGYGILGIILMQFTIQVNTTFILDFRNMSVLLAMLHAGFLPSLAAGVIIAAYRILAFGLNLSSTVACINLLLIVCGCYLIRVRYRSSVWKQWWAMNGYSLVLISITFSLLIKESGLYWRIIGGYGTLTILVGLLANWFLIYLQRANTYSTELEKKQKELEQIFDNVEATICSWDRHFAHASISMNIEKLCGYSRRLFLHNPLFWLDIVHLQDRETVKSGWKNVMVGEEAGQEYRIIRADGKVRWVQEHFRPILDTHGEFLKMIGVLVDVTDRKLAEQELVDSKNQLSITLDSIGDGVISTNAHGQVTYLNPVAENLTGWGLDEAYGRKIESIFHIVHSDTRLDVENPIYRAIEHNRIVDLPHDTVLINRKGFQIPIDDSASPIRDQTGSITGVVLVFRDMIERKRHEEQIRHYAFHDSLTGLPNRRLFYDRLKFALANAKRQNRSLAVMFLDLDHFKLVNDSLGHDTGDLLLNEVSRRLLRCANEGDTISRLGGDEFTVILEGTTITDAGETARRIRESLSYKYHINGHEFFSSPSIGISMYPADGDNVDTLIKNADTAMYHVKMNGKNGYRFFTSEMNEKVIRKLEIDKGLRNALEKNELELEYQPKIDLGSGEVTGFEALLRWSHPEWGRVSPDEFIPVAEEGGFVSQIGEWVMRTACRQFQTWRKAGITASRLAVNLSVQQLHDPSLPDMISRILQEEQMDPACLELEITESVMKQGEESIKVMRCLKEMGIYISIDDFGTGYSSLSYLNKLPIDALKIDKSFIRNIFTDKTDAEIVITIITLAKSLNLQVIAEGVETVEQLNFLRSNDCHEVQGYLLGRPAPPQHIEKMYIPD